MTTEKETEILKRLHYVRNDMKAEDFYRLSDDQMIHMLEDFGYSFKGAAITENTVIPKPLVRAVSHRLFQYMNRK